MFIIICCVSFLFSVFIFYLFPKKKKKKKRFLSLHPNFIVQLNKTPVTTPSIFGLFAKLIKDTEESFQGNQKIDANIAYQYCVLVASLCLSKSKHNFIPLKSGFFLFLFFLFLKMVYLTPFNIGFQLSNRIEGWFHNPVDEKTVCFDQNERYRIFQVLKNLSEFANTFSQEKNVSFSFSFFSLILFQCYLLIYFLFIFEIVNGREKRS